MFIWFWFGIVSFLRSFADCLLNKFIMFKESFCAKLKLLSGDLLLFSSDIKNKSLELEELALFVTPLALLLLLAPVLLLLLLLLPLLLLLLETVTLALLLLLLLLMVELLTLLLGFPKN